MGDVNRQAWHWASNRADATVERIGEWMSGLWDGDTAANVKEVAHAQA